MGKTARVYIEEVWRGKDGRPMIENEKARMELGIVWYDFPGFLDLFTAPADYPIQAKGTDLKGNETLAMTKKDVYGDPVRMAKLEDVVGYLKGAVKEEEGWRLKPLLGMLEGYIDPHYQAVRRDRERNIEVLLYNW